ncbi:MAG: hypothetical protein JO361_00310, partial [Gammaproteobacteria bacterium]|nr:hypothetical protein [Gammaproteobacteria bacterium]
YELGDFATVEQAEREALEEQAATGDQAIGDHRARATMSIYLAMAQARQGHLADAARTIAPVVTFERDLMTRNHGDAWVPVDLAGALYAQALADPGKKTASLAEAASLIDGLAPEMRSARDVQRWRTRIASARSGRVATISTPRTVRGG